MVSNGDPITFYHGTKNTFDIFDKNKIGSSTDSGWLGEGFYFYTDIIQAQQYGKVSSYYLKIENPYYATRKDNIRLSGVNNKNASKRFTQNLKSQGYDGIYYNGDLRGETVVFEPEQIWRIT